MAKKIAGFLAGTSYAPSVSTDEALLRRGCEAIMDAKVSSAIVMLEDGSFRVGHPTYNLDPVAPELIVRFMKQFLMQDDFATRPVRSDVRTRLRAIEGKSEREQFAELKKLMNEYGEFFLAKAGTEMDDAARKREADLDARCALEAA